MNDTTTYQIYLNRVTGLLVYWSTKSYAFEGTYDHVLAEYNKAQKHNKIWGWWSGMGPFITIKFLKANDISLKEVQAARAALGLPV